MWSEILLISISIVGFIVYWRGDTIGQCLYTKNSLPLLCASQHKKVVTPRLLSNNTSFTSY